jgi:hypothetical protein
MTEATRANRRAASGALRSCPTLERVFWPLGVSFALSVAITFALLVAFIAAGHRSAMVLQADLRGTISD